DGAGQPRWIEYSHQGLLANTYQLAAVLDLGPADTIFCAPSLAGYDGLLLGMVAPLALGIGQFHFSSAMARAQCAGVYDSNATVVFGDDDFLLALAQAAHRYDMARIRRVLAVGERLGERTCQLWRQKLGHEVYWLYGGARTGIISANTPMHKRPGTRGKLLPGVRLRPADPNAAGKNGGAQIYSPGMALGEACAQALSVANDGFVSMEPMAEE
ncbi:MAG: AMP-binding protein, partial [Nitrospinota bacterium]|nr:AMP-binding protein [Nitrospinota bacterium]